MRGAGIAAGLLLACLAFALAFVPRRTAIAACVTAAAVLVGAYFLVASPFVEVAFAGCWISLAIAALSVYWPETARSRGWLCLAFGGNVGIWAGLVLKTEAPASALLPVIAVLLLTIPARFCVARGWEIAPRVVTSWLLAVALLVGAIPHLIVHPGYVPDHRE